MSDLSERGFKVTRDGPASYSVEGFFRDGAVQRFRAVSGLQTEAAARQWVYTQQALDDEAAALWRGGG